MTGPDRSGYEQYLVDNRAFMEPVVATATGHLPAATHAVDLGTGAGGALPHLAALAARVSAVDLEPAALELARRHVEQSGLGGRVELLQQDGVGLAEAAASVGRPVDLVWASDVIWPGTFTDPAAVVRRLASSLAPGGALALLASNYYRSVFMAGHARLERLVQTASEMTWGLPTDGPQHPELLGAWMHEAGLQTSAHSCGRSTLLRDDPAAQAYVTGTVWPEYLHATRQSGRRAGMTEADIRAVEDLLDPHGERWLGAVDTTHVTAPAVLWIGRRA